jgi:transposase
MEPKHLFTTALGLTAPWEVTDVRFDPQAGRIDLEVAFAKGSRFACPACGVPGQPVHDTRKRSWQHLSFFQYRAYLHAHLPRVRCEACGKTIQVQPPWARAQSGFTALMEALVVTLCQAMPVATVARHLGVGDERLWGVLGDSCRRSPCPGGPLPGARRGPGRDRRPAWTALHQPVP